MEDDKGHGSLHLQSPSLSAKKRPSMSPQDWEQQDIVSIVDTEGKRPHRSTAKPLHGNARPQTGHAASQRANSSEMADRFREPLQERMPSPKRPEIGQLPADNGEAKQQQQQQDNVRPSSSKLSSGDSPALAAKEPVSRPVAGTYAQWQSPQQPQKIVSIVTAILAMNSESVMLSSQVDMLRSQLASANEQCRHSVERVIDAERTASSWELTVKDLEGRVQRLQKRYSLHY
jgi:hypothetical protein